MQGISLPRLELQLLLAKVLEQRREWLIAHDDHVLTTEQSEQFGSLHARRLAGEPMAYLLGQREFMGLAFVCFELDSLEVEDPWALKP